MKAIAITYKGIEDICSLELSEILNVNGKIKESAVIFDASEEDILKFSYLSRSARRVLILIEELNANGIDELNNQLKNNKLSEFSKNKTFAVRCIKEDSNLSSKEIEDAIGSMIDGKVDLDSPDTLFIAYNNDSTFYIGIDTSGFDLSKRDYKIFNMPSSLKGNIAYALIRIAGWQKDEALLDAFTSDGVIPIEAALFGKNISINNFRKERFARKIDYNDA